MRGKLTVAAVMPDGRIGLVEEDIPETPAGCVLLEVKSSLVSPGSELRGWRGLARGDSRAGSGGRPMPFGYSNAGVVLETGEGVNGLRPGDRVAAIGGGYARHATHALVPQNLCVSPAGRRDLRPGRLRDALGYGGTRPAPRRPRLRRVLLRSRTGAAGPVDGPDVPTRRLLRNRLGYDCEEARDSSQVGDRRRRTLRPGGRGWRRLWPSRVGVDSTRPFWRSGATPLRRWPS